MAAERPFFFSSREEIRGRRVNSTHLLANPPRLCRRNKSTHARNPASYAGYFSKENSLATFSSNEAMEKRSPSSHHRIPTLAILSGLPQVFAKLYVCGRMSVRCLPKLQVVTGKPSHLLLLFVFLFCS